MTKEDQHDNLDRRSDPLGGAQGDDPGSGPEGGDLPEGALQPSGPGGSGVGDDWALDPIGYDREGSEDPLAGVAQVTLSRQIQARSGPLPDPAEFAAYEEVLPGSADRILTMAERALEARIEDQHTTARAEARAFLGAAWAVSFFPWLLGVLTIGLMLAGESAVAAVTALVTAATAGPQIIAAIRSGRRRDQDEDAD
ncbi:DUF2335 domain-containing protein [Actinomyces bowdenii]|uniref:DUF2335 domain-containing protein n=1 Tax=Actinomyces bowdenii TaxID=131109 RepID=A0A853ELT9_9ACTO|nr:DUF2335 domain-containing protein [Actinomyces bowdenii]MBF0698036.1 DUF2335 domain-containing protein [Actinomyces bowdenii]NYS70209.1 DUF2335 domain-containing protein [Actinomyces bowdenii]